MPYTIGITTKDRPAHLAATVAQLARIVPDAAELLVIDDGSHEPVDAGAWGSLPFPLRLIRYEKSKGLIAARNILARECRSAFLLSCDDDSYPISGEVRRAADYMETHPGLIALSFPYLEGPVRRPMNPSVKPEPYPVRQFIGCAHLMRVEYFQRLGGYWEWLVQQNEERDLCYRALHHGWGVAHFPGVGFYHDYTPAGRNWDRHEFYTMRNEMAVARRHLPLPAVALKLVRNLWLATWGSVRSGRTGSLRGFFAGSFMPLPAGARLDWTRFRAVQRLAWC